MALLTAGQQASLNRALPIATTLGLGSRLTQAESLQAPGRIGTGHIRIATNLQDGDTVTVNGVIYEADNTAAVTAGNILVTIGGTAALTATALAAAIRANQGHHIKAAAHATDTTVIDMAMRVPGAPLSLATTSGGRAVVQDNAEELAPTELQVYVLRRTVTAEDDTRDRVRIDTGLTTIVAHHKRIITSSTNNTEIAWTGATVITGGVIELDNTGSTDLAAGHIIELLVVGTL